MGNKNCTEKDIEMAWKALKQLPDEEAQKTEAVLKNLLTERKKQPEKPFIRHEIATPNMELMFKILGDNVKRELEETLPSRKLIREQMPTIKRDGVIICYDLTEKRIIANYRNDTIGIFPFMPPWWIRFRVMIFTEYADWVNGESARQERRRTKKWNKRARKMRKIERAMGG